MSQRLFKDGHPSIDNLIKKINAIEVPEQTTDNDEQKYSYYELNKIVNGDSNANQNVKIDSNKETPSQLSVLELTIEDNIDSSNTPATQLTEFKMKTYPKFTYGELRKPPALLQNNSNQN